MRALPRPVRLALVFSLFLPFAAAQNPAPVGWNRIGQAVRAAIAARQLPGAVVLVGHEGRIVYRQAFGNRETVPRREQMTPETIFDLASLTKVVATAPAMMQLYQEGKFRLNDPVAQYLPGFAAHGKGDITIRDLLTHYSGLPADLRGGGWHGWREGVRRAEAVRPLGLPGLRFRYSDINFIVLGALVRKLSGEPLNVYCQEHIWRPLDMRHTRYLPPVRWRRQIAPTEWDGPREGLLRGVVQDPTARRMGGVAGNAGVFSDADDLAKLAQMYLNHGRGANGAQILSPVVVEKMTTPQTPFNVPEVRGLGWDLDTPFSSNRGELLPVGSYGHTGYTGTSLWIDPYSQSYIVILSNAVYPHGRPPILSLRAKIADICAQIWYPGATGRAHDLVVERALEDITGYNEVTAARHRDLRPNDQVLTGLDVLKEQDFAILRGKRVGLITNPSGIDRDGHRNIDDMVAAGIDVTAAFSPEHGWSGVLDTTKIGNTVDHKTGVPVFSAYGAGVAARQLPEAGLRRVNILVYDIQDAGVRFYTFETTLAYSLQAAAAHHIPILVLDRPDPIDGINVQGPPLAAAERSFIGFYAGMPVRNGMTVGELAKMFNRTRHIGAALRVIRMQGWSRGDYFDQTGLPWVNPSPNLRNLTEAILYPGVALIEYSNVSVGRGTDTPFEWIGAPWIDGRRLADYLNARRIPGVRFIPVAFTPSASKYAHQLCHGVYIVLTNRRRLDAPEMGVELASALAHLYPRQWNSAPIHSEIGSQAIVNQIEAGVDPRILCARWQASIQAFKHVRHRFLLY
ncbi:MAG: serine hydrolase [Terriglobales bacterium]